MASSKPRIMGIVNCTNDSFYSGGRYEQSETAVKAALQMVSDGADIIDLGGESTRPGAGAIDTKTELGRVLPVLRELRRFSRVPVSVDTRKSVVAEACLDAGADMINDVSALRDDPGLKKLVAERGVPVVLMHMQGNPETMQDNPVYTDVIREVREALEDYVEDALASGIGEQQIILDPGIGFGKRLQDNLLLLKHLAEIREIGFPVLVGVSRKSFLGQILSAEGSPLPAEERLYASLGANCAAWLMGAEILRVHDVRETAEAVKIFQTVMEA
ncbi:MAG: dihydropteroate synthase [Spirochaetales bacterium]|nr:dihydropteroate synthase [Spirochaetales bacterium]MCF7937123.1 dihydropteroate synthase [Spirochaetales bacterium]